MFNPNHKKRTALGPYQEALEEGQSKSTGTGGKKPLTVDQMEQRDLTYLEKTYGAQAERDAAAHEAAVKAQEAARKNANREAYIGSELMQKYLPQYQAMQGTSGMGTSQTDAAAAMNAYFGRVSGNNAEYARNVAALDQQKAKLDYQRDAERREQEYAVRHEYNSERQAMAEEESDGLLGLMSGRADGYYGSDGKISPEDYQNLWEFYAANESRLTEAGKRNAQDMLAEYRLAIRDAEEQAAVDRLGFIEAGGKVSKAPTAFEEGKNFEITGAGGERYRVQIAGEATDEAVLREATKVDSGEVFGYGGRLYIRNKDKVYAVDERSHSYKDEFSELYELYFGRGDKGETQEAVTVGANQTAASKASENQKKTRKGRG